MNKLIFIGLGLYDGLDISIKGIEALKNSDLVYAEFYTGMLIDDAITNIEKLIKKKVHKLSRDQVENGELILDQAQSQAVAFLCQGDPLTATTHVELLLRAREREIDTQVIHCASVATAVPGLLGLQFYKFGRTTTLAYPEGDYFPHSPYDILIENKKRGLHTLILLDIQSAEKKYMTANEGIELLLRINSTRNDGEFSKDTLTCVVARAGSVRPTVIADKAGKLIDLDFGPPLHSIVVPGNLHFKEVEALIILANAPKMLFNL